MAVLLVVLAVLAAVASGASASPRQRVVARGTREAKGVAEYWTRHRMRAARPADEPSDSLAPAARAPAPSAARGSPVRIPGRQPRAGATGGRAEIPESEYAIDDPTVYPYSTQGKVYFREKKRHAHRKKHKWVKYECSGTAVHAENQSVVFSAGHCAYDPQRRRWASHWTFIPGYEDYQSPLGKFAAKKLWVIKSWRRHGNPNFDVSAAVVAPNASGRLLEDVAGSRGLEWNQDRHQHYDAYGYPAGGPFDGQTLWTCGSDYKGQDTFSLLSPGPAASAIDCDVTGGASGGGWVISGHYLDGLTSYVYSYKPNRTYGPYFGGAVGKLYDKVRAR